MRKDAFSLGGHCVCVSCGANLREGHMERLNRDTTVDFPLVGPHERVRFTCAACGRPQTRYVPVSLAQHLAKKPAVRP